MRVFVTGASGWIGSAVIPELLAAGHEVIGLARSDDSAAKVSAAGADVVRGGLDDLDVLRSATTASDGVIHLGFKHDFSDMAGSGRTERAAVETMCSALAGSDRPFLFASGVLGLTTDHVSTERDPSPFVGPDALRGGAEELAFSFVDRGVRPVSLRFSPTVHGTGDHGFMSTIVAMAKDKGVAAYVGDGANRWPAVHVLDAAVMVRLALEKAPAGSVMHGVAEEGIAARDIAEVIGRHLDVPVESVEPERAFEHFGWIGGFFALDAPSSSAITREVLGWTPTHPGLITDLESGSYFRTAARSV